MTPNYDFFTPELKAQVTDAHSRLRGIHQYMQICQKAGLPMDEHIAEAEEAMKLASGLIRLWTRR